MSSHVRRAERPRFWNRVAVIAVGILLISWGGPAASAYWQSLNSNTVLPAAAADTIAGGATPSVSVAGTTVTVSWAARLTTAGKPVTGYVVGRYSAPSGGSKITPLNGCSTTISGLSCTETSLGNGTWYYTVTPAIQLWRGAESARSLPAVVDTIAPATPVFTSTPPVNIANQAAVPVTGTTEAGATITLTVTDAGTAHTVTQIVTANGTGAWTATVNLTSLVAGTVTYKATATDASGNVSSIRTATAVKDITAPTVSNIALMNGGTTGLMGDGDKIIVTYAEPIAASSFCSQWNDGSDNTEKSSDVTVTISSSNVLTVGVKTASCTTFRFGSVALGGNYYASGSLTFNGSGNNAASTVSWDQSSKTLTITLGDRATGTASTVVQPNGTPTYTPASGLTDMVGNPLGTAAVPGSSTRF